MTRTLPIAIVAVLCATVSIGSQQTPKFRAGVRLVSVYATVASNGKLITDLTKDDFDVFDNGVRQAVSVFANDLQPITVVVMLDRSANVEQNFGLVRTAAEQFVYHLLPGDKARIGTYSADIQIEPAAFTNDRTQLLSILHADPGTPATGQSSPWDAATAAMDALVPEAGRRVVLLFAGAKDVPADPNIAFDAVRRRAQADEIMMYTIGLSGVACAPSPLAGVHVEFARFQRRGGGAGRGGLPGGRGGGSRGGGTSPSPSTSGGAGSAEPCSVAKPDADLLALAEDNGGGYFELHGTDGLALTFARVAAELHHQYLLAFTPAALDGATHAIEVRVKQPDMTVRARKTYVATPEK